MDDEKKTTNAHALEPEQKVSSTDLSMRIAWRYQSQPKFEVSLFKNPPSFDHISFLLERGSDFNMVPPMLLYNEILAILCRHHKVSP